MTDDEKATYHHNAAEGETHGPDGTDPHHALNTPVDEVAQEGDAVIADEEDEGERLEDADDRAEEQRIEEGREGKP